MNKTEATLTKPAEQLEHMSQALTALRRELLPGQPKKLAILAEGSLENMCGMQREITQLVAGVAASSPAAA